MIQLPGSSVLPKATNFLAKGSIFTQKKSAYSSLRDSRGSMTGAEYECLLEVKSRLNRSDKNEGGIKKLSPYYVTNTRLQKARQNIRSEEAHVGMRSKSLEKYLLINRNELEVSESIDHNKKNYRHAVFFLQFKPSMYFLHFFTKAAICLQCFWRRIIAERHLHRLSVERMSAIIIQAAVRSMLTRCWLRVWKRKRDYFIVRCQAHLRQRITNRRWIERRKVEYDQATCIQAIMRMYLAKCELALCKRNRSADKIIAHYRGYRGRNLYKIMRHSYYAKKIQATVRAFLTKKYFERIKEEKFSSARDIQRCWRGLLSRKLRSSLLHERYTDSCQSQSKKFMTEVEYFTGKLEYLENHDPENVSFHSLINEKAVESESSIIESEMKLDEQQKMLAQLTPRSVQQGWKEQMEKSVLLERAILTRNKMNNVFVVRKKVVKEKLVSINRKKARDELIGKIASLKQWNSDLTLSLQQDTQLRNLVQCKREKRQRIADEKRKWKVQHKHRSGKPYKMHLHNNFMNSSNWPKADNRDKTLIDILHMQMYSTQLSQLDTATKPFQKLVPAW